MKIIILAGGKGTRISEYTKTIPKPMIKIEVSQYFSISLIIMLNMDIRILYCFRL